MPKQDRNEYQKEYRRHKIHRLILFSKEEDALLLKKAKEFGKPFGTVVREMALAQASNQYLMRNDQLKDIRLLLIRLGTNTNQLAFIANATFNLPHEGIQDLQKQFKSIHQEVNKVLQRPIPIDDVVQYAIEKDPRYIERIQNILNELR